MEIKIIKATLEHIPDCVDALVQSELGRQYFTPKRAEDLLLWGMKEEEMAVAVNGEDRAIGFVLGKKDGIFAIFPYIHVLAVTPSYQGQRIGTRLMDYCEKVMFAEDSKLFLVVADFNAGVQRWYERLGYVEVGQIPDLYKKGVTEYLMMKIKQ